MRVGGFEGYWWRRGERTRVDSGRMGFRGLRRGEGDDRGVLYELGWFAEGSE